MKKIGLIILICIFFICGCSSNNKNISYEEAKTMIDEGAILIDVRTLPEYNEKHIENAILMPVATINEEIAKQNIMTKDSKVIVYCKSGNRSKQALKILTDLGYTEVYDLGSINNWQE